MTDNNEVTKFEEMGIVALRWLFNLLGDNTPGRIYLLNTFRELSDYQRTTLVGVYQLVMHQERYS